MLTVTLRDKDGGERQLTFEDAEISIGRMDGNHIVLARNNISKKHATIMAAEGAILVTDQRSTNGTYVNGRRISAPQELTPEDKIYIGDFVLQASASQGVSETTSPETQAADPPPMPPVSAGPTDHLGSEAAVAQAVAEEAAPPAVPELPAEDGPDVDYVDEFVEMPPEPADDLMDELEDVQPEPLQVVDPALTNTEPPTFEEEEEEEEPTRALSVEDIAAIDAAPPAVETPVLAEEEEEEEEEPTRALSVDDIAAIDAAPAPVETSEPEPLLPPEPLVESVEPVVLEEAEPSIAEEREPVELAEPDSDPIPPSVPDEEEPTPFEVEEGLGILTTLFGQAGVEAVQINGTAGVLVSHGDGFQSPDIPAPSHDELNATVVELARILELEADDARFVLSGSLPSGLRVEVVGTDFSTQGPLIIAKRPSSHHVTPQALVDAGLEGAALETLGTWVKDGANIVIVGLTGSGRTTAASSLAQLIDPTERIAVIERRQEIQVQQPNVIRLDRDACVASGSLAEVLESMRVNRVVFDDVSGPGLAEFIGLAAVGYRGLIGVMKAASADELLRRLPHELSFFGQGEHRAQGREWIADAIDVLVVTENNHIRTVLEVSHAGNDGITTHIVHGE